MEIIIYSGKEKHKCILGRGRHQSDTPKTYKKVGVFTHNIGNNYNPCWLELYINKQGVYKYSIYRDGCFYPFIGTITLPQDFINYLKEK